MTRVKCFIHKVEEGNGIKTFTIIPKSENQEERVPFFSFQIATESEQKLASELQIGKEYYLDFTPAE